MSRIEQIQSAIEALPHEDFVRLAKWINQRDWEEWDRDIEADGQSGKLDFLLDEAADAKAKGSLKGL
ncbi:hypothetical protein [Endothiovibrio diazotrophicus]